MAIKVLVTSASKHGSTFDIADVIAGVLARRGLDVVDKPVGEVGDVKEFGAVIIGSAVYVGKWMPEAVSFVERHAEALEEMPVWLFSSGPLGDPPRPNVDPVTIADLASHIGARPHRIFAGRLEGSQLGLGEKLIVNMVRAPSGDFRDFQAVDEWANEIADTLLANTPEAAWDETDATREALLAGAGA